MKKKKTGLLLSLLALAVCVGGYLGVRAYNDRAARQKTAGDEAAKVYLSGLDEVTGLSFTNSNGEFSFLLRDGVWYYGPDEAFPLKQSKVQAMVGALSALTAARSFEPTEGLSSYGLEPPALTLTASGAQDTVTLLFGGKSGEDYYVKRQGETQVHTVSTTLVTSLSCTLYDLVELETFPSLSETALNSISLTSGGSTLTFEKETVTRETEPEAGADGAEVSAQPEIFTEYVWYVSSGDGARTAVDALSPASGESASDLMDGLVGAASFLRFESCVNYKADAQALAEYGLDAPSLALTVSYTQAGGDGGATDGSFTLSVGALNPDSSGYYAVREGSAAVNLMDTETVSTLFKTLGALRP